MGKEAVKKNITVEVGMMLGPHQDEDTEANKIWKTLSPVLSLPRLKGQDSRRAA